MPTGASGFTCPQVGDLLGAAVLGLSTTSAAVRAARAAALPRPLRALLRPPFSVSLLATCHAALLVQSPPISARSPGALLAGYTALT